MILSDAIAAAFNAHPEATVIITSVGHAYGRAKFAGRCKLTGAQIQKGATIRTIEGVCRNGRAFKVVVPSPPRDSVLLTLGTGWQKQITAEGPEGLKDLHVYSWSRCSDAWAERVAERVADANPGAMVRVAEPNMCGGLSVTTYTLQSNGKWQRAGTYRQSTTKALVSSLRRSKRYTIWQVTGA